MDSGLETGNPHSVGLVGRPAQPLSAQQLLELLENKLGRSPLHIAAGSECVDSKTTALKNITKVAWCTGAAQNYIDLAVQAGADAFISGEISESTVHTARECGIHYFAAGHHATERGGVKAVGDWLGENYPIEVEFVDIDNPV